MQVSVYKSNGINISNTLCEAVIGWCWLSLAWLCVRVLALPIDAVLNQTSIDVEIETQM